MFITALFTIANQWKQARYPTTDERIKKYVYICIYIYTYTYIYTYISTMEFYSAIRNNGMWFEDKWMQLQDIIFGEVSQVQKDKGCMFSLIHGR
jgi:hypothetical protein